MRALFATKPRVHTHPKQSAEVPISVEYQIMQLCFWAAPNMRYWKPTRFSVPVGLGLLT